LGNAPSLKESEQEKEEW